MKKMHQLSVHGKWTLEFKNRILHTQVSGPTNKEASDEWLEDALKVIELSDDCYEDPWVVINDARDWEMASLDFWESANDVIHFLEEKNCVLFVVVFSRKIHQYTLEKGLDDQSIVKLFGDYDEAYQACIDKLAYQAG
ncbi:hypothetical protein L4C34_14035 [Vibrio profundum]|uniref:hypothetical protein n=1 Tax=Vibrio profundum TaxID=2910247 RepID=UPI003D133BEE